MKKLLLLLMLLPLLAQGQQKQDQFIIQDGKFLYKGEPIQLICGEMHYPRIPREYWEDRIIRAKAMGLNTISAYVFWGFHEREEGKFDFTGQADIAHFVKLAKKHDMFVLLRPGPYVCAEWDYGGYPSWVMEKKDMLVRSRDPKFIELCSRYLKKLGEQLAPYSINNGGNIVMVQVENEYGSYSDDKVYLGALRKAILDAGFNAPLMTCDGGGQLEAGLLEGTLTTINGVVGEEIMKRVDQFQKGGPYFVAEFYPAWFDVWGKRHSKVDLKNPTAQLDWMLKNNVSISIYMFHGGTNFFYTNGANNSNGYEPQPTSYDYDAPLGEWGNAYPKYWAFRETIQKYTKKPLIDVPANNPCIAIAEIKLTESTPLSTVFKGTVQSDSTLTMEELGQDFGYIHYETTIDRGGKLTIRDLRDYAVILLDGVQVGSLDRRFLQNSITIQAPAKPAKLEILVENVGRVNYGSELLRNRKGITDEVLLDGKALHGWAITPLPLYKQQFGKVKFAPKNITGQPAFHRGTFEVNKLGDTFLDMRGFCKGAVWVNGHSIGKYWSVGPQQTLYVPAPWLKKGTNEVIVFEMEPTATRTFASLSEPILEQLGEDRCKIGAPKRANTGTPILDAGDKVLTAQLVQSNDWQVFNLAKPATLRHLCIEFSSAWTEDNKASLREIELMDENGKQIEKSRWSIFYVSSEDDERNKGIAENAIDLDPSTDWRTKGKEFPHRIIIDLGEIQSVSSIRLLGKTGAWIDAQGKDFNLYARPQFFLFNNAD